MKNFLIKFKYFILGGILMSGIGVYAASLQPSFVPSLIPVETSKYYLGSSSPNRTWKGLYVDQICLAGDCQTAWSAGGGEANTASNLGTGLNIFDSKVGVNLRFNSIAAGANITLSTTTNSNTIVISSTGGGGSFPFTVTNNYNSTSTVIAFLQGLFSTASSTFGGPFRLSSLSNGELAVYSGLVGSYATTTAGTGLTYSGNAFNVNTTQNITKLSNLTGNGLVKTSGGDGTLGTAANGTDYTLIAATTCGGTDKVSAISASGVITCSADQSGGGSGSGNVSTSTSETAGRLAYFTSNSGTPALLGEVATTTVTATSPLSFSNTVWKVGGSNSVLSLSTTTTSLFSGIGGNILAYQDGKGYMPIATSSINVGTASALFANGSNCSSGNAPLGVDASGAVENCFDVWTEAENTSAAYTPQSRTLTVAGTANQITSSAGAQDLTANRTWTLSFPNQVIFPQFASSTLGFSTVYASTTALHIGTPQGFLYVGSGQKVNAVASSSINILDFNNNLASLTATNATLTFSGAYNGATARTVGLNLANANSWSGLQTFAHSSTTGQSTFFHASTTYLTLNGLTGNKWSDFCTAITGSADLCDGNDASGGSSTSAFEIATTSNIALSNLAYFTNTSGRTTLGSVATTTVSAGVGASFTPFTVIGSSPITISGIGGGSPGWATSTPYTGGLTLYPLQHSSINPDVLFGATSTTTAPFWWDVSATSTYIGSGGLGTSTISFSGSTGTQKWWNVGSYSSGQTGTGNFYIASSSSDSDMITNQYFTISQAGNVGVSTTTPGSLFSIQGVANFVSGAISTIYNGLKVMVSLIIPFGTDPTVNTQGQIAINTTVASSSVRFHDGTAERSLFDTFDKPTIYASSTLAYDGGYGASATTTYSSIWNPSHAMTLVSIYCKTDVANSTAWYEVGTGSATSTVKCTSSGAENSVTTVNFTLRQSVMEAVGMQTGSPNRITVTPTFRYQAD